MNFIHYHKKAETYKGDKMLTDKEQKGDQHETQ